MTDLLGQVRRRQVTVLHLTAALFNAPTRIEAARRKAIDLLRLAPETRMALMPFAAMPVLRCPLTGDHDALAQMLQDCSPELFPAENGYQGTAIGDAVRAGLGVLGKQSDRGQAILVMSDGADDDKAAVAAAAKAAKSAGIPVYGLFFADPQRKVTLLIDGKEEVMDADRTTLDALAHATGGIVHQCRQRPQGHRAPARPSRQPRHPAALGGAPPGGDERALPLAPAARARGPDPGHPDPHPPRQARGAGMRRGRGPRRVRLALALLILPLAGCAAADPWEQLASAAHEADPAKARATLEALLTEQPTFYPGHFNLGTLLLERDPAAAATHLEIASASPVLELEADALHNLALVRWKQGRLEEAVDLAARAARLRGDDPVGQKLLSELRRALVVRADQARRTAEEEARKLHLAQRTLADAHAGEPYDQRIAAAGGTPPYRFSLGAAAAAPPPPPGAAKPPALPAGLELDGDGRLHGSPQGPGAYVLTLALRDGAGATVTGELALRVLPVPAITTSRLPEAVVGSPYHALLEPAPACRIRTGR